MSAHLISKIIKFNNKSCPDLLYENPLLDKTIAREVAKSFMKILKLSNENPNIDQKLRYCVLGNIRKLCQVNTKDHVETDDNFLEMLCEFYFKYCNKQNNKCETLGKLDVFIRRNLHELHVEAEPNLNPEIIQAIINISNEERCLEKLSPDIARWNENNYKYQKILKILWESKKLCDFMVGPDIINDVSIKMKTEIELQLLLIVHQIILNINSDIDEIVQTNEELQNLISKCSVSQECFISSIEILNALFIMSIFNNNVKTFIPIFLDNVRKKCLENTFSHLYPFNLQNAVLLMDINLDELSETDQQFVKNKTLEVLTNIRSIREDDLILLLSHFPNWFDIYFSNE